MGFRTICRLKIFIWLFCRFLHVDLIVVAAWFFFPLFAEFILYGALIESFIFQLFICFAVLFVYVFCYVLFYFIFFFENGVCVWCVCVGLNSIHDSKWACQINKSEFCICGCSFKIIIIISILPCNGWISLLTNVSNNWRKSSWTHTNTHTQIKKMNGKTMESCVPTSASESISFLFSLKSTRIRNLLSFIIKLVRI